MVKISLKQFKYYPRLDNKDFQKKIYMKKEFNETKYKKETRTMEEICNPSDFSLFPTQRFLKNFISIETPYNGVLIFHGTGVGKSCSAVSIAENFIEYIKKYNKRVIVLSSKSLKKNFIKTIFNLKKDLEKKTSTEIVQCTGNKYSLSKKDKYLTFQQKQKLIKKKIKTNYKFYGYGKFANLVKSKSGWDGTDDGLSDNIKKFIEKEYSNTIIIIDEVHNIKKNEMDHQDKQTPVVITAVMKYSKNIKLILMSATPMFDKPQEIIFITNLLLLNDNRPIINQKDIFDKERNANLLPDGREHLLHALNGYISYVRAENPYTYPVKIYPSITKTITYKETIKGEPIPKDKQLKYIKTLNCLISGKQLDMYDSLTKNTDLEGPSNNDKLIQISNIVYPTKNEVTYGKKIAYELGETFIISKDKVKKTKQISFNKAALINEGTKKETSFLNEKYIKDYSKKFSELLKIIKKSKGPILLYSYYKWSGVIPLALFLEQNGVERYLVDNEQALLKYPKNKKGGGGILPPISYDTGKPVTEYKNLTKFKSMKYAIVTDSPEFVKITPPRISEIINSQSNVEGSELKIIIGTKVISEGIDFSRIRQIHILDPWYNISRNQQIIGRGLRSCSHVQLPPAERNVEVLQYAAITNSKKESADMYRYRLAEEKDIKIKKVERIMKEVSIDCLLNLNRNIIKSTKKIKMISASGEKINYKFGFEPYSAECDYEKDCSYKCISSVKSNIIPDTSTYTLNFAEIYINKIMKNIKDLYRHNIYYTVGQLKSKLNKNYDDLYIYIALDKLLNDKNNIIFDRYDRAGYLIYRGNYYIFQPNEIRYKQIPVYYRQTPLEFKIDKYSLLDIIKTSDKTVKNNKNNKSKDLFDEFKTYNTKYKEFLDYLPATYRSILLYEYLIDRQPLKKIISLLEDIIKDNITNDKKILSDLFNKLIIKKNKIFLIKLYDNFYVLNKEKKKITKYLTTINPPQIKYGKIYGVYNKNFKLLDTTKYTGATTLNDKVSKRSIIKGRTCSTFDINILKDIYSRLISKPLLSNRKKDLCFYIEIYLRYLNNTKNSLYFESNIINNLNKK